MNDNVHPVIRQYLDEFAPSDVFDEHDRDLMHDVVAVERLIEPVQALLITRAQLKRILGSFGEDTINKGQLLDQIMPELDALYEACKLEWEETL